MTKEFVLSILRHILTSAGSVLMAKGYIDDTTYQAIVGGTLAVIGLVWSYYDKASRQTPAVKNDQQAP
jgi:hypothetical protein